MLPSGTRCLLWLCSIFLCCSSLRLLGICLWFHSGLNAFVRCFCCDPRHDCVDPFSVRLCCSCPRVWLVRALCRLFSAVCAIVTVGTVTTHPRSPAWHRKLRNGRQTARLRLRQNFATPADHWKIAIHHGSCLPGAMSQKGRRQQKEWKCGDCQRWTWSGSKC